MKKTAKRSAAKSAKKSSKKSAKKAVKKPVRKAASKSSRPRKHVPTPGLDGWITHTDIGSTDPQATRDWCARALGWRFRPKVDMPGGEYHLFAYSDQGGGGIHPTGPNELPGSIPYVHVADAHVAFDKAIREGADPVMQPERIMEGVTIGIVRAPGGVKIGISGP